MINVSKTTLNQTHKQNPYSYQYQNETQDPIQTRKQNLPQIYDSNLINNYNNNQNQIQFNNNNNNNNQILVGNNKPIKEEQSINYTESNSSYNTSTSTSIYPTTYSQTQTNFNNKKSTNMNSFHAEIISRDNESSLSAQTSFTNNNYNYNNRNNYRNNYNNNNPNCNYNTNFNDNHNNNYNNYGNYNQSNLLSNNTRSSKQSKKSTSDTMKRINEKLAMISTGMGPLELANDDKTNSNSELKNSEGGEDNTYKRARSYSDPLMFSMMDSDSEYTEEYIQLNNNNNNMSSMFSIECILNDDKKQKSTKNKNSENDETQNVKKLKLPNGDIIDTVPARIFMDMPQEDEDEIFELKKLHIARAHNSRNKDEMGDESSNPLNEGSSTKAKGKRGRKKKTESVKEVRDMFESVKNINELMRNLNRMSRNARKHETLDKPKSDNEDEKNKESNNSYNNIFTDQNNRNHGISNSNSHNMMGNSRGSPFPMMEDSHSHGGGCAPPPMSAMDNRRKPTMNEYSMARNVPEDQCVYTDELFKNVKKLYSISIQNESERGEKDSLLNESTETHQKKPKRKYKKRKAKEENNSVSSNVEESNSLPASSIPSSSISAESSPSIGVKKENASDSVTEDSKTKTKQSSTKKYNLECQCDICHRMFSRKYDLNRHRRIHTGDKPYKCKICGLGFTRSDHRDLHVRRNPCGRTTYYQEILRKAFYKRVKILERKRKREVKRIKQGIEGGGTKGSK